MVLGRLVWIARAGAELDHLAGRLGVAIADVLVARRFIVLTEDLQVERVYVGGVRVV